MIAENGQSSDSEEIIPVLYPVDSEQGAKSGSQGVPEETLKEIQIPVLQPAEVQNTPVSETIAPAPDVADKGAVAEVQKTEALAAGFELQGLGQAQLEKSKVKGGYSWVENAEKSRDSLLRQLQGADSNLEDPDKNLATRQIVVRRIQRWNVLSSVESGKLDESLNKKAYEIAEQKQKSGNQDVSGIESNDQARRELLDSLGKEITEEEIGEERKRIEKERNEADAKNALELLADSEIMSKSPDELEDIFRRATGKSLKGETDKRVEKRLDDIGKEIVRGEEAVADYRGQLKIEEQGKIRENESARALETLWERNPDVKTKEDRARFLSDIKKRLGLEDPSGNGLDGAYGDVTLVWLTNQGLKVEAAKVGGLFSKKIVIPKVSGGFDTFLNKTNLLEDAFEHAISGMSREAERVAGSKIAQGRETLLAERVACSRAIIGEAVKEYGQRKQEPGAIVESEARESEQALEYVSLSGLGRRVGKLGGDYKKIIPRKTQIIIDRGQSEIEYGRNDLRLSDEEIISRGILAREEWNKTMRAKEEARQALQGWIEKNGERKTTLKKSLNPRRERKAS